MGDINTKLLLNDELFKEIHQLKNEFVNLYSEIANQISEEELSGFASNHKGKKISKGNELQHCPYQVLDLVRDFDTQTGFNIRFLNWWGHGMYVIIYHGATNLPTEEQYLQYLSSGYKLSLAGSPWDYKSIIIHDRQSSSRSYDDLSVHLKKIKHLQLIKPIPYPSSFDLLKSILMKEWRLLKKFRDIK